MNFGEGYSFTHIYHFSANCQMLIDHFALIIYLKLLRGKGHYFINRRSIQKNHRQSVNAESDSG